MKLCYNRLNSCYLSDTDSAACLATTYTIPWLRHSLHWPPHITVFHELKVTSCFADAKNRVPTYWDTTVYTKSIDFFSVVF